MATRDVRRKKIRKEFQGLTKEERKAIVLQQGKEALYLSCPLCGFNRSINKYLEGRNRFTDIDLSEFKVLVTRVGGGLGSGFFRVDERSHTIEEMKQMPEYADLMDQIGEQAEKILKALK